MPEINVYSFIQFSLPDASVQFDRRIIGYQSPVVLGLPEHAAAAAAVAAM